MNARTEISIDHLWEQIQLWKPEFKRNTQLKHFITQKLKAQLIDGQAVVPIKTIEVECEELAKSCENKINELKLILKKANKNHPVMVEEQENTWDNDYCIEEEINLHVSDDSNSSDNENLSVLAKKCQQREKVLAEEVKLRTIAVPKTSRKRKTSSNFKNAHMSSRGRKKSSIIYCCEEDAVCNRESPHSLHIEIPRLLLQGKRHHLYLGNKLSEETFADKAREAKQRALEQCPKSISKTVKKQRHHRSETITSYCTSSVSTSDHADEDDVDYEFSQLVRNIIPGDGDEDDETWQAARALEGINNNVFENFDINLAQVAYQEAPLVCQPSSKRRRKSPKPKRPQYVKKPRKRNTKNQSLIIQPPTKSNLAQYVENFSNDCAMPGSTTPAASSTRSQPLVSSTTHNFEFVDQQENPGTVMCYIEGDWAHGGTCQLITANGLPINNNGQMQTQNINGPNILPYQENNVDLNYALPISLPLGNFDISNFTQSRTVTTQNLEFPANNFAQPIINIQIPALPECTTSNDIIETSPSSLPSLLPAHTINSCVLDLSIKSKTNEFAKYSMDGNKLFQNSGEELLKLSYGYERQEDDPNDMLPLDLSLKSSDMTQDVSLNPNVISNIDMSTDVTDSEYVMNNNDQYYDFARCLDELELDRCDKPFKAKDMPLLDTNSEQGDGLLKESLNSTSIDSNYITMNDDNSELHSCIMGQDIQFANQSTKEIFENLLDIGPITETDRENGDLSRDNDSFHLSLNNDTYNYNNSQSSTALEMSNRSTIDISHNTTREFSETQDKEQIINGDDQCENITEVNQKDSILHSEKISAEDPPNVLDNYNQTKNYNLFDKSPKTVTDNLLNLHFKVSSSSNEKQQNTLLRQNGMNCSIQKIENSFNCDLKSDEMSTDLNKNVEEFQESLHCPFSQNIEIDEQKSYNDDQKFKDFVKEKNDNAKFDCELNGHEENNTNIISTSHTKEILKSNESVPNVNSKNLLSNYLDETNQTQIQNKNSFNIVDSIVDHAMESKENEKIKDSTMQGELKVQTTSIGKIVFSVKKVGLSDESNCLDYTFENCESPKSNASITIDKNKLFNKRTIEECSTLNKTLDLKSKIGASPLQYAEEHCEIQTIVKNSQDNQEPKINTHLLLDKEQICNNPTTDKYSQPNKSLHSKSKMDLYALQKLKEILNAPSIEEMPMDNLVSRSTALTMDKNDQTFHEFSSNKALDCKSKMVLFPLRNSEENVCASSIEEMPKDNLVSRSTALPMDTNYKTTYDLSTSNKSSDFKSKLNLSPLQKIDENVSIPSIEEKAKVNLLSMSNDLSMDKSDKTIYELCTSNKSLDFKSKLDLLLYKKSEENLSTIFIDKKPNESSEPRTTAVLSIDKNEEIVDKTINESSIPSKTSDFKSKLDLFSSQETKAISRALSSAIKSKDKLLPLPLFRNEKFEHQIVDEPLDSKSEIDLSPLQISKEHILMTSMEKKTLDNLGNIKQTNLEFEEGCKEDKVLTQSKIMEINLNESSTSMDCDNDLAILNLAKISDTNNDENITKNVLLGSDKNTNENFDDTYMELNDRSTNCTESINYNHHTKKEGLKLSLHCSPGSSLKKTAIDVPTLSLLEMELKHENDSLDFDDDLDDDALSLAASSFSSSPIDNRFMDSLDYDNADVETISTTDCLTVRDSSLTEDQRKGSKSYTVPIAITKPATQSALKDFKNFKIPKIKSTKTLNTDIEINNKNPQKGTIKLKITSKDITDINHLTLQPYVRLERLIISNNGGDIIVPMKKTEGNNAEKDRKYCDPLKTLKYDKITRTIKNKISINSTSNTSNINLTQEQPLILNQQQPPILKEQIVKCSSIVTNQRSLTPPLLSTEPRPPKLLSNLGVANTDIKKIFGITCMPHLVDRCHKLPTLCNYSHQMNDNDVVFNSLYALNIHQLTQAYNFMYQHLKLFKSYFLVFSNVFSLRKDRNKLLSMVIDCERYPQHSEYLMVLYESLVNCGLSRANACRHILQRIRTRSPVVIEALVAIIMKSDWTMFVDYMEEFAQGDYNFRFSTLEQMSHAVLQNNTNEQLKTVFGKCVQMLHCDDAVLLVSSPDVIHWVNLFMKPM